MNTRERTRTAKPRNQRWGWGLLALLLVLALGLGIWFAFLRQTPQDRFIAALDKSFAAGASALDDDQQLRGFQTKLAEGYRLDIQASVPAEDFGALSFQLAQRAQPAEALQATEARLGMGQFDLFAGAIYSDADRLQFRFGSAESADSYELRYEDSEITGFRDARDVPAWTDEDQETKDALEADLAEAKEALYEDLEVDAAGRQTVQVDGEDVEAEIVSWRATNDDLTVYLDRIETLLMPAWERLDTESYLERLPAELLPEDLDILEERTSFEESYAAFKQKLEEAEWELTGGALLVGDHVYELTVDPKDTTDEALGPFRYRSYLRAEPGIHVELTFPDGTQIIREREASEAESWSERWTFTAADDAGQGTIGFHYRDGATDGRYRLTLTELTWDGEDLIASLDLHVELVTEVLPIAVLSETATDVSTFAADDWARILDSLGPLFGGLPSGFE